MTDFFAQMDTNKDGKLSGDEIPSYLQSRVSSLDTDKDGAISKAEMDAAMKRFREAGGGRPGSGAGGPGS